MKVFMFDTVSQDVPSFGSLPRVVYDPNWSALRLKPTGGSRETLTRGLLSWPKWLVERFGPDLFHVVKYVALPRSGLANLE